MRFCQSELRKESISLPGTCCLSPDLIYFNSAHPFNTNFNDNGTFASEMDLLVMPASVTLLIKIDLRERQRQRVS